MQEAPLNETTSKTKALDLKQFDQECEEQHIEF